MSAGLLARETSKLNEWMNEQVSEHLNGLLTF